MPKKSLADLYAEHSGKVSDKWSIYLTEYGRIFEEYRERPVRLLEIGIQNGGSLEIWAEYFKNAEKLIGCDVDPDCALLSYDDPRVAVVIGDANDDSIQEAVLRHSPELDIVIDDGSHRSSDIVKSFARYFPYLSEGGIFVAEDLHCSYWQEFEGGLFAPFSSIAFFKRLVDVCNHEHWGVEKQRIDVMRGFFSQHGFRIDEEVLAQIHAVEFINSMCIVRKCKPEQNTLGARVIAGSVEMVAEGILKLDASSQPALNQERNIWTSRALLPEEEQALVVQQMAERDQHIVDLKWKVANLEEQAIVLNQRIADLNSRIGVLGGKLASLKGDHADLSGRAAAAEQMLSSVQASTSWRISAPIRAVGHELKRVKRIARRVSMQIRRRGGIRNTLADVSDLYQREGTAGLKRKLLTVEGGPGTNPGTGSDGFDRNDYAEWIRRYDVMTEETHAVMRACVDAMPGRPLISVVMPTYNSKPEWLIQAIESVRDQIYPNWELCIADDASTSEDVRRILEDYAREDRRIKIVLRKENGHISAASNSALELTTGEWVALLDHDDLLAESALFWVADAINRNPHVRLIYSDEDKIDAAGKRVDPYFKCDWNRDLFYSHNMISHLGVYQASLLREIGGFRIGFEGAQDYDLALRCVERIGASHIHHIPRVLYHWRVHDASTAQSAGSKPYAMLAGERALNEHFERKGIAAKAELVGSGYRVHYSLPQRLPLVTIIIPTRNGLHLIRQCVASILEKTTYPSYDILIIDNGSDDPATIEYFKAVQSDARVRVVRDERPFNYSALNNAAVALADGELVGLLNNDIEVISPGWLSEMVSHALRPDVGAVGACLWFPDNRLQHGGVVLGLGGVASHAHKGMPRGGPGYFGRAVLISEFSAVTGACLLIRRKLYEQVQGLNETDLKVAFNDVDFCLRLRALGYRNVWTPYAELYHHESATRGLDDTPEKQHRFAGEIQYMNERWGDLLTNDPAYSPNLTLWHEDFSFAWPPRRESLTLPDAEGGDARLNRVQKALMLVDRNGLGLEIGPAHNPLAPKRQGFNVHILDHVSTEDLRRKYEGHGVNLENIEEVDFVWQGEPLHESVGGEQCYDWIIASHLIEHVPDVITFFRECERLLKPNGVLSLVIPDKRYCFDHFSPLSSTGELLDAFFQHRTRPTPGKVFDHFAGAARRGSTIAWSKEQDNPLCLVHSFSEARAHWERAANSTDYIDVHNWRFTPSSFRLILADLHALGLTRFAITCQFDTEGCEFFMTLQKAASDSGSTVLDRLVLLESAREEA